MTESTHALESMQSGIEPEAIALSDMQPSERVVMTGTILFALGLVIGVAIGSATAVAALTQGAPDVLQSWSGVVALP